MSILYYFHDPMCSWCYAFDQALNQIEANLPESVSLTKIVGGLAPDSTEAMPELMIHSIKANWRKIEMTVPGVQFNFQFWEKNQPIRSTYPACRAVLAAQQQAPFFADQMIKQIQLAYYKNAQNPSLDITLINCARQIGLDYERFKADFTSAFIASQLRQQIHFARQQGVSSFPSLSLKINERVLSIKIDYNNAEKMLKQIHNYTRRPSWDSQQ